MYRWAFIGIGVGVTVVLLIVPGTRPKHIPLGYPRECLQLREHVYETAPGRFTTITECDRYK